MDSLQNLKLSELEETRKILKALIQVASVDKILNTYIKAFKERSILKTDGNYYLHGLFSLGTVKSGRLSSKSPNLTALPSGSQYGKLIKSCFGGHSGEVMLGADFNSLESVVNALITKDPNKQRPLIQGIDSHGFNAYYYYPEELGHIPNTVEGLNSIKKLFPKIRSNSKPISFSQQYGGSWRTLMKNCGLSEKQAKAIEANYQKLYKVSVDWTADHLKQAAIDGYVTGAFGLRLRTPLQGHKGKVGEGEVSSEARTAGNTLGGQSYSMLTNRAAIEFMQRVYDSKYKLLIKPVILIHDAIYITAPNTVEAIKFANDNLIECMQWCDLPELQHDDIKLGAELDIFYPSWADATTLSNNESVPVIREIRRELCQKD